VSARNFPLIFRLQSNYGRRQKTAAKNSSPHKLFLLSLDIHETSKAAAAASASLLSSTTPRHGEGNLPEMLTRDAIKCRAVEWEGGGKLFKKRHRQTHTNTHTHPDGMHNKYVSGEREEKWSGVPGCEREKIPLSTSPRPPYLSCSAPSTSRCVLSSHKASRSLCS
jgi:hypothetical protein